MVVAEYCGNCDRKTMRQTEPCQVCTPKNVESQTTDTQQLKAKISAWRKTIASIPGISGFGRDKLLAEMYHAETSAVCGNVV